MALYLGITCLLSPLPLATPPHERSHITMSDRKADQQSRAAECTPLVLESDDDDLNHRVLLPFAPASALLIGETMSVALSEASHLAAYSEASFFKEGRQIGMCLRMTKEGGGWASSCSPLLQVVGTPERDKDGCPWIFVRCVARDEICRFDERDMIYDAAFTRPLVDDDAHGDIVSGARKSKATDLLETVHHLYDECAELRDRLRRCSGAALDAGPVMWCSDSKTTLQVDAFRSLDSLTTHRATVLRDLALDAAPATSLEPVYESWGVRDDATAQRQLASFTAFSFLSAQHRLMALRCTDTEVRLRLASRMLKRKRSQLQAKVAMYETVLPKPEPPTLY